MEMQVRTGQLTAAAESLRRTEKKLKDLSSEIQDIRRDLSKLDGLGNIINRLGLCRNETDENGNKCLQLMAALESAGSLYRSNENRITDECDNVRRTAARSRVEVQHIGWIASEISWLQE